MTSGKIRIDDENMACSSNFNRYHCTIRICDGKILQPLNLVTLELFIRWHLILKVFATHSLGNGIPLLPDDRFQSGKMPLEPTPPVGIAVVEVDPVLPGHLEQDLLGPLTPPVLQEPPGRFRDEEVVGDEQERDDGERELQVDPVPVPVGQAGHRDRANVPAFRYN